nr:peptide ABC transporter substrate-binding protein [Bacilli bacterium]
MKRKMTVTLAVSILANGALLSSLVYSPSQALAQTKNVVNIPLPAISTLDSTQWGTQNLLQQGTILEGLYGYNSKNQIVPKIATGYKVSQSGKVWTFYLRHDARWSNGKPVTAQDFYNGWMYDASPKNSASALWASMMTNVVNAWNYHAGTVPASQVGVKVLNPYAIQVTLNAPFYLLGMMPLAGSMPLYQPDLTAHPSTWFMPQNFVGDGPYLVQSFVPNGEIQLVRNPDYVGAKGQFNVGNVDQINIIPTPTVPVEDFVAGKLDTAMILNPSDYKYALSQPTLKKELHVAPANEMTYLSWDKSTTTSPLDNLLVRQAIAMAIDRTPLANAVMAGMGGAANGFGTPGWPTLKYEKGLPFNVAKAKALLAKAGYPNGKGIPTLYLYTQTQAVSPISVGLAEALQQELTQALGINFQIDQLDNSSWDDVVYAGLNPGIKPGYVLSIGQVNWFNTWFLTFQSIQWIGGAGVIGPASYRQYVSQWYFPTYDPMSIYRYGNPADVNNGMSWSSWLPLQKAVLADNSYLQAYAAKQPAWYQKLTAPAAGSSTLDLWNNIVNGWKTAKTDTQKHAAWVQAWKFVGNESAGNGNASIGLDGQVYQDKHQPVLQKQWNESIEQLAYTPDVKTAVPLAANIVNGMMQQGYVEPLVYNDNVYLAKSNLTGVQANPWSDFNFYQLQYIKVK